jgi:hypothetical protein
MKVGSQHKIAYRVFITAAILVWAPCMSLGNGSSVWENTGAEEKVFKLTPSSVFKINPQLRLRFARGLWIDTQETPLPEIKAYPKFKSPRPLYGTIVLGGEDDVDPSARRSFAFVLDSTHPDQPLYNLLTIDLNRDLDLSNDRIRFPLRRQSPAQMLPYLGIQWQAYFPPVHIPLPCGDGRERSLEIIPRVIVYPQRTTLSLVTSIANQGMLSIGGRKFRAVLGHSMDIPGWFDHARNTLYLIRTDTGKPFYWQGADQLKTWHRVNGTFYGFSATPIGDRLSVRPYRGPMGTLKIGAGPRKLDRMTLHGSLESSDRIVAVGSNLEMEQLKPAAHAELPVGDYRPFQLIVEYGTLRIDLRQNLHSEEKLKDRQGRPHVYGLRIREHEPYVLDFSNTPQILFASPASSQTIRPGQRLSVKAMLTDPHLDMFVRNLETVDHSQTSGRSRPPRTPRSPTVLITRADGQSVAEGVMPFG